MNQEEEAKEVFNDEKADKWISDYLNRLPEGWNKRLDMYLAMKNAMLEALSKVEEYKVKSIIESK